MAWSHMIAESVLIDEALHAQLSFRSASAFSPDHICQLAWRLAHISNTIVGKPSSCSSCFNPSGLCSTHALMGMTMV